MPIDQNAASTGARLHKSDCARYQCGCLAAGEEIRNGDLVFKDNATGELFPDWTADREFVGLSISCVCNDSDACIAIEYQKAHIDETEFALPFDDATFEPTGTQFFNFTEGYPTTLDSGTEGATGTVQLVTYYDSCLSDGCSEAVRYGVFKKSYCC